MATPFIAATGILLYYEFMLKEDVSNYLFVTLFFIVLLYVSHGYIDYWYHKKFPLPLDEEIIAWLRKYSPFYNSLSIEDKEKYHYRMSLYLEAREFKSVGSEQSKLPDDIMAIIASNSIQLNFHKKDFLMGDFDRIFVYKHPFPSPQFQFLHSVESQGEDGVLIFSLEHLIPGMIDTENFYNIGMHGYIDAFCKVYPNADYPWQLDAGWPEVESISGLSKEKILSTLGFDSADMFVVLATCYFGYPKEFARQLPTLTKGMDKVFG